MPKNLKRQLTDLIYNHYAVHEVESIHDAAKRLEKRRVLRERIELSIDEFNIDSIMKEVMHGY